MVTDKEQLRREASEAVIRAIQAGMSFEQLRSMEVVNDADRAGVFSLRELAKWWK